MNLENMWKPAAVGGLLLGILSSLPFISCACCVWVIGGGALAAYLYVKEAPAMVTLGHGVYLGLLAGIIGSVIIGLFQIPLLFMSPEGSREIFEQVRQTMDKIPGYPEEYRESFMELSSREGFISFFYILSMGLQLVLNCLLAMLGGALGVAIFEKRQPGDPIAKLPGDEPPATLPPPPPPASE